MTLPFWDEHITLQLGEENVFFPATLRKRLDDGLSRVVCGWRYFVDNYDFHKDEVLIFCLLEVVGSIYVRVFRMPGA